MSGLVNKIHVSLDPTLEERGQTAVDRDVTTKGGEVLHKSVDIACGFPGNALTQEEHHKRFQDCFSYAGRLLPPENVQRVVLLVSQ